MRWRPLALCLLLAASYTTLQFRRLRVLACAAGGLLVEAECIALRAGDELDPELRQIAALARASNLRGDRNYIVRRGAILHSDVPMLAPQSMDAPGEVRSPKHRVLNSTLARVRPIPHNRAHFIALPSLRLLPLF